LWGALLILMFLHLVRMMQLFLISGTIAIEMGKHVYVCAMDNGMFTLGAPRPEGEGPDLPEQLTGVVISDSK